MTDDTQPEETFAAIDKRQSPKSFMVSFRVKPSEFAQLKKATSQGGHGRVSDFARTAALDVSVRAELGRRELRTCVGQLGKLGGKFDALTALSEAQGFDGTAIELQAVSQEIRDVMKVIVELLP